MPAEIITIASLKGGANKTITAYALTRAAAAGGLRVIAIDLDPAGGLTTALAIKWRSGTIADVLLGGLPLKAALTQHPSGARLAAAHRSLIDEAVSEKQLDALLGPVRADCDVIVLDTDASEPAVVGPMAVADHIVIPTGLDILSLRAAALTVGLAQQRNILDRIRGIAVANVERPASRTEESLLEGLSKSGLAFETVLWSSPEWAAVLAGGSEDPPAELPAQSKRLLREVALRKTSVDALRQFVGLAHARSLAAV
ncbi:MAG TPA: AAA family ATPase [Candidatus Dormibacteraeota bacterium]